MKIEKPITPDGRTGFDQFGQLVSITAPDEDGYQTLRVIRDVRPCTCYICGRGWGNTTEELANQTNNEGRMMHETCLQGVRKLRSLESTQTALADAGFLFDLEEVPPRYPYSTPWQRVTVLRNDVDRTDSGWRIVLGRRKRVWEVRLHQAEIAPNIHARFNDVTNTKGHAVATEAEPEFGPYYYVHAWDKEELVDYLKRFHSYISQFESITRA